MASSLILFLSVLSIPFIFLESTALASPISSRTDSNEDRNSLICEIQKAKLELAQLETLYDKSIRDLDAKSTRIRQNEKKIQEMNQDISRLQITLSSFEDNIYGENEKLRALEEQIQLLWAASRQNNFEIFNLEFKAHDAEERLNVVTIQGEEMAEIVSEQWTQIQQLEQALQMAQLKASQIKRQLSATKCPFVKSIKCLIGEPLEMLNGILYPYVSNGKHILNFWTCEASHHIKRAYMAAKNYHHLLQGYIKQAMLRNEFTAVLAYDEVVFFIASALVTFPVLSLYMLLSSHFS